MNGKLYIVIITTVIVAFVALGFIIRFQNQHIHSVEEELGRTKATVEELTSKAKQLTIAIRTLDNTLDDYIKTMNKAQEEYAESLKKIDQSDPIVRDWLDLPIPACVQDAIAGDQLPSPDPSVSPDNIL